VLGDGNDVLVLELHDDWFKAARRYPAHSSELVVVSLGDIASHHTVGPEFHAYFSSEAEREGIEIAQGRYDSSWNDWVSGQRLGLDLEAARCLLNELGLQVDLRRKRSDGYAWPEVMLLARNSKAKIRKIPKHVEHLLQHVRTINTAVAGVRDFAAYTVAANLEWIQIRLKKDPMAKGDIRQVVDAALLEGQQIPWQPDPTQSPAVFAALQLLHTTYPRAYTDELTPEAVGCLLRLIMGAKDQTLNPMEIPATVGQFRLAGPVDSATLLCVAVSSALGPLLSRQLTRVLGSVNMTMLDWSTL